MSSLISLDLSNFDTSQVINMNNMFTVCSSLISLNLSNFDTSKVTDMDYMFYFCDNLEYVNFKTAKINSNTIITHIIEEASQNLIIACENADNFLANLLREIKFNYCNNNSYYHQIKYFSFMSNPLKYDKYSCDICGQNFYTKHHLINETDNTYIDCYEIIDNYYLDDNDWSYKPCYYTCKNCEINGSETNHNCLSCKDDFFYEYNIINTNYKNCYNNSHTENRTEIIQNIINDFITEFNIIIYFHSE